jgi:hypothetical protein
VTPAMRAMIQSLYPTGNYRDLDEKICKQYFNKQRAEAYALRDKIGAIPGGDWISWGPDEEMMRSRTVRIYVPSVQNVDKFSERPKSERISIISIMVSDLPNVSKCASLAGCLVTPASMPPDASIT